MKLKRFVGADVAEAVAAVRLELGRDAVIVQTRRIRRSGWRGLLRRLDRIEVLAAVEEPPAMRPGGWAERSAGFAAAAAAAVASQPAASAIGGAAGAFAQPWAGEAGVQAVAAAQQWGAGTGGAGTYVHPWTRASAAPAGPQAQPWGGAAAEAAQGGAAQPWGGAAAEAAQGGAAQPWGGAAAEAAQGGAAQPWGGAAAEAAQGGAQQPWGGAAAEAAQGGAQPWGGAAAEAAQGGAQPWGGAAAEAAQGGAQQPWGAATAAAAPAERQPWSAGAACEQVDDLRRRMLATPERLGPPQPVVVHAGRQRVVMLVGPTGAGKTTTVAKLAAHFAYDHGWRVGVITADTFRAGGAEQLACYARLLSVPCETAGSPRALERALARFSDCEVVLVDTSGRGHRDAERMDELARFVAAARDCGGTEAHLVIPATLRHAEGRAITHSYRAAGAERLILTKLDECEARPEALGLASLAELPLSYFAAGQRVPEDIAVAWPDRLAAWAEGGDELVERRIVAR